MIKAYVIGFILLGIFYGLAYPMQVFFVSLLVALIPLATSKFWFGLPILILIYHCAFGSPAFAGWCVVFAPFHWLSFVRHLIRAIKGIWNID